MIHSKFNWKIKLAPLLAVLLLTGCLFPRTFQSNVEVVNEELNIAVHEDRLVQKRSGSHLPPELGRMMVPCFNGNGGNLPAIERRFDIVADQVPARLFFLGLVKDTPYNMSVPNTLAGTISLQLKKVTIPQILETARDVYGYDFRRTSHGFEIIPPALQTRSFKINYIDMDRDGKSEIRVSAGGLKSSNTNTGGGVFTPTTAAATVEGIEGINQQITNSRIVSKSKSDFWHELKLAVETLVGNGEGRKVAVSPMSGLIVVQAMPNELRKVSDFLRKAELTLNRQVILEAKILEVELLDSYQAGINWEILTGRLRATQFGGQVVREPLVGHRFPILNDRIVDDVIPMSPGRQGVAPNRFIAPPFNSGADTGAFGGVFTLAMNYKNLATFVELLGAQGTVRVLSSPRISTMNNQKALIKVGRDEFFITNISTTTTAIGTTASTTPNVTFDPFFSGIALDVTPSINEKDEISLHIHPAVSEVQDEVKNFTLNGIAQSVPLAASTVRESDSLVRAKSGQIVVIGGLMQDTLGEIREGIPYLMDLPVIGHIFYHKIQRTKKSELVILLRPIIMDDNVITESIEDVQERFRKLERGC